MKRKPNDKKIQTHKMSFFAVLRLSLSLSPLRASALSADVVPLVGAERDGVVERRTTRTLGKRAALRRKRKEVARKGAPRRAPIRARARLRCE